MGTRVSICGDVTTTGTSCEKVTTRRGRVVND
jgi:hypothetical protein